MFNSKERDDILPQPESAKPRHITSIDLYSKDGEIKRKWDLETSYFEKKSLHEITFPHVFKRLKLNAIKNVTEGNQHGFSYHEERLLPAKNNKNTDYWGYFNGREQGSDYVFPAFVTWSGYKERPISDPQPILYHGGNKEPDLMYSRLGTLNKITWPTGASTKFTYENNVIHTSGYYYTNDFDKTLSAFRGDGQPD